jgi:hypothetical protein
MDPKPSEASPVAGYLTLALAIAFFLAIGFWPPRPEPPRSAPLRARQAELRERLVASAREESADPLGFVRDAVLPHFAADERLLYPEADRRAGGRPSVTAALRHLHAELRHAVASGDRPRAVLIAELLFDLEEQIVFPLIDRSAKSHGAVRERELLP